MKKRYWYGLDRKTNPLGFGCWQIAGIHSVNNRPHGWGYVDEKEALSLLTKAIESGIDFFDTAQGYGFGKSEELLGEAIRITNGNPVVCTKIPLTAAEIATKKLDSDFVARVDSSLSRLSTDRIDILLIHNPPDDTNWKEFHHSLLFDLQAAGKIGTFGVSSTSIKGAASAVHNRFGTVIEWVFNIFERRPSTDLFPLMRAAEMNFIARSPLSRGLINPKYLEMEPNFREDDYRSTLPKDWVDWVVSSLRTFHKNGVPTDELIEKSISFCLRQEAVTATVVGIKTVSQLDELIHILSTVNGNAALDERYFRGIAANFPPWG